MATATSTRRRGLTGGVADKTPCIAASTANLTLSGEQTVDGIALVGVSLSQPIENRCLVKNQTDPIENGIYVVATGTWQRAVDWDGKQDIVEGTMVRVNRGTTNSDTYWRVSTTGDIEVGVTSVALVQGLTDIGIAATYTITDESTDTTCFPLFVTAATGDLAGKTDSQLTYNSSTGELGAALENLTGTTDATSATTGTSKNAGGAGIAKTAWIGQDIVLDERADHAATSAAANGIIWNKSTAPTSLMYTDDTAVDHALTSPVVASHVRAGNTQIWDGSTLAALDAATDITTGTFETVGPTGSGALNIWTPLDVMPSNATIVLLRVSVGISQSGANAATMSVYATSGDSAQAVSVSNRIALFTVDTDGAITGNTIAEYEVMVPLEPTNLDFRLTWASGNSDSDLVNVYYKGFMTD